MPQPQAEACWLIEPGRAAWREEPLPAAGADDLVVRTLHTAISRGTETLVFRGEVPSSEFERMRAPHQAGHFPAPVKYGYCNVGVVEQGPAGWAGEVVFCLYPHQTRYVVPAHAVHKLPEGLPAGRAVLAANVETAINALWDASPRLGDRVTVVGAGTVGLLTAWLASQVPGCQVQVVDTLPHRRQVAQALGLDFALPDQARPDADLVIHASAQAAGLETALRLAAFEAVVLELSWYGQRPVSVPLGEAFHSRRLVLKSSQVGHVATTQRARWSHARRFELALALLSRAPVLDTLITDTAPHTALPEVLARLASSSADTTLCYRIDYP